MTRRTTNPLDTYPGRTIFDALGRYRYLTGEQVTRLFYAPSSEKYALKHLKALKDAGLVNDANFLPKTKPGPGATKSLWSAEKGAKSAQFVEHLVLTNDVLIALERFARDTEGVELLGMWHDVDLKQRPLKMTIGGKPVSVIPDGFVTMRVRGIAVGIAVEADRGTEALNDPHQSTTWAGKVSRLVAMAKGDAYKEHFGVERLRVAVAVRSHRQSSRDRVNALYRWTETLLSQMPEWRDLFLMTDADPAAMPASCFVTDPHWISPGRTEFLPLIPAS